MRSTSLKRPYNLILLTYLEFIFINDLRWESSFISSPTDSLLCSHYLLNKSLFFHWVKIPHFHIQNSPIKWDLFQNCPSVLWSLQLSLCPDHIDLLWWLFSALIPSKVDAFLLCFFLHVPWLFTGIFFLHLKFKIIILNYPPKAFIGILSGIALMYSQWHNRFYMILTPPSQNMIRFSIDSGNWYPPNPPLSVISWVQVLYFSYSYFKIFVSVINGMFSHFHF